MKKEILSSEKILDYIEKNPWISSSILARKFDVTTVAIFYKLRELIMSHKIEVVGKSRATRYFIKKSTLIPFELENIQKKIGLEIEETYKNIENLDIEKLLSDILLILLPDGQWREGVDAFYEIVMRENQSKSPSEDLFSRRLISFLIAYFDEEQKRRKNWFFDGTDSINHNLQQYNEVCYVTRVYFTEINKLWRWWKLRTWTEMYHGKSLQNKKLLIAAIDRSILRIQQFFIKKWVDAIILTPPTIPRQVQFREVFMERFGWQTFEIRAEKIKDKNFRPQKELRGMDRIINARASVQVDIPQNILAIKHIVIIDDNFTTGATVNAIAWKIRNAGYQGEITVITITGNFGYVVWVTDAEEI
jgi:hypothetical protein